MAEKITLKTILERFKNTHGNKYDYSKVIFTRVNDKVIIICSTHGEFEMRPKAHSDDLRGCPNCDKTGKSGFSDKSNWVEKPKFIYLIEVVNDKEKFLKFGVTVEEEIKKRFQKGQMPYLYNTLFEKRIEDGKKAFEIEKRLKAKYPKISFVPSKIFSGYTECLEYDIKEHLIKDLKSQL
jgi:hypothetical protein